MIKRLLFTESADSAAKPSREGIIEIENNILDEELFEIFSDAKVLPNKSFYSDLVDAARPVKDFQGNELLPSKHMIGGNIESRIKLGNGVDIGAVEYR